MEKVWPEVTCCLLSFSGFSRIRGGLEGAKICKSKYLIDVGYVLGKQVHWEVLTLNMYNQVEPPTSGQLSSG